MIDLEEGFQTLHAIWAIEQYLHKLTVRKCSFDIVFFNKQDLFSIPANSQHGPRYLLLRKIAIQHLTKLDSDINIHEFDDIDSKGFQKYLKASAVYFALTSDGAQYGPAAERTLLLRGHVKLEKNESTEDRQIRDLRASIFKLGALGLDVALLNGLDCRDSKVFAFVLERQGKSCLHNSLVASEVADLESYPLTKITFKGFNMPYKHGLTCAQISYKHIPSTAEFRSMNTKLGSASSVSQSTRLAFTIPILQELSTIKDIAPLVREAVLRYTDSIADHL